MNRIAIIGSGLSAIAAAKILIERGIKPIILDVGNDLESARKSIVERMANSGPKSWSDSDISTLMSNPTTKYKENLPKKLAFGSEYVYAKSKHVFSTEVDGGSLPFSFAKGGFSAAWGAAALPPDACDLSCWPLNTDTLKPFYKKVLDDLPYSACKDGLEEKFPLYSNKHDPLNLSLGNKELLSHIQSSVPLDRKSLVFGQARLLVRASNINDKPGCINCGYCMSGCVYDCIYKASYDLDSMIEKGQIDYIQNTYVHSVEEKGDFVEVVVISNKDQVSTHCFRKVFIGAGAVGSARIVLQGKKLFDREIKMLSTVGFVAPMVRMKRVPFEWPDINTQPGIFLEYKIANYSNHWVHSQISTPNELVYEKLGINRVSIGLFDRIKRFATEHLIIAACNMHSDHANPYYLTLKKNENDTKNYLVYRREKNEHVYVALNKAIKQFSLISKKFGCFVISPLVKDSAVSDGYHLGGTLPMKENPVDELDTNILGSPKGWKNVHVIDSSVFPSLPGTTVGLLAMANAMRIATETEL